MLYLDQGRKNGFVDLVQLPADIYRWGLRNIEAGARMQRAPDGVRGNGESGRICGTPQVDVNA